MSAAHLGETFDIHGGGQDLIFPHHENELAQSTCGTDGGFARYWMHNGYVVVQGEKMSKSLGNFFTVRQLLEEGWPGEAIRLALLSAHYRQPLDITRDKLKESKTQLDRLYGTLRHASDVPLLQPSKKRIPGVQLALEDDLNTPKAISLLHEWASGLNSLPDTESKSLLKTSLRESGHLLGLLQQDPEAWSKGLYSVGTGLELSRDIEITEADIERMIEARNLARKATDFDEADRIRDELKTMGIELEDGVQGTTWKLAD
jgi:cysteinyl-tRNA synthetase